MGRIWLAAVVFFLGLPVLASAALIPNHSTLEIGVSPQYPAPGENVILTVNNIAPGADRALYTWSVDGKVVLKGIGETRLSLQAGDAGQSQEISVSTDTGEEVSTVLNPASVAIIWEGETSVPPLYIGRPLATAQSPITFLAVPRIMVDGVMAASEKLVYTWKEDGAAVRGASGYGKSSVVITPPRFGSRFSITVHAETVDGRGSADGSVVITPEPPRTMIYQNAPLLGIRFEKSVNGAFNLKEAEASFSAFPLFLSNVSNSKYQWTLDGKSFAVDPARPFDVTFRKVGDGTGTHHVAFSFSNPTQFTETGESTFTLSF